MVFASIIAALLIVGTAEAAELRCARTEFRLGSTGKCVSKASELGRRYYHGGERRHGRAKRHRVRSRPIPPVVIPADPEPAPAPPSPADPAPAGFGDRFYYGKGDRLRD